MLIIFCSFLWALFFLFIPQWFFCYFNVLFGLIRLFLAQFKIVSFLIFTGPSNFLFLLHDRRELQSEWLLFWIIIVSRIILIWYSNHKISFCLEFRLWWSINIMFLFLFWSFFIFRCFIFFNYFIVVYIRWRLIFNIYESCLLLGSDRSVECWGCHWLLFLPQWELLFIYNCWIL